MTNIVDEFKAYRDKAMAANEGPFAVLEAGYAALKAFVLEDWPEVAAAFADDSVRYREVGHGHRGGALCELTYEVGTEALGRRTYDMAYNEDSRAWVPSRRSAE